MWQCKFAITVLDSIQHHDCYPPTNIAQVRGEVSTVLRHTLRAVPENLQVLWGWQ